MGGGESTSEWENSLFSHHFIGVKIQTLFKTSLNLVALSILHFHTKVVNYGYLVFKTYPFELLLAMLFHFFFLENFSRFKALTLLPGNASLSSYQTYLTFSYTSLLFTCG